MGFIVQNINFSLRFSLTALKLAGLWVPPGLSRQRKILYYCYTLLLFMFFSGIYLILQIIDLYMIWGNLPLMTGTALILFTNISQATKIVNLIARRKSIDFMISDANDTLKSATSFREKEIVKRCDRETRLQQCTYLFVTIFTAAGWAGSAKKNQLPVSAWYPYDTTTSPAYQVTYTHQVLAVFVTAVLNISKDTLVTTLIAQTRCRLRLVSLGLRNICSGLINEEKSDNSGKESVRLLTGKQEAIVKNRLRICVQEHQRALKAAKSLQDCFSEPTFTQLTVSLIIICVTAFQVSSQTGNLVRFLSMSTYLLNMVLQVFLYCYQGHQLSAESEDLAGAAYEMPWYMCSVSIRRSILIMMIRCHRTVEITAGGFTTLSLATFTAIIKLSYSMFTLLQQVNENQ